MKKITVANFIDQNGREITGTNIEVNTETNTGIISKTYKGVGQPAPFFTSTARLSAEQVVSNISLLVATRE
jgi:hypothetical protein